VQGAVDKEHIAVFTRVQHSFDLSPNLSPTRREALKLAPFPGREGGWGLGMTVPRSTENRYIDQSLAPNQQLPSYLEIP
jgi:hypothetical protein